MPPTKCQKLHKKFEFNLISRNSKSVKWGIHPVQFTMSLCALITIVTYIVFNVASWLDSYVTNINWSSTEPAVLWVGGCWTWWPGSSPALILCIPTSHVICTTSLKITNTRTKVEEQWDDATSPTPYNKCLDGNSFQFKKKPNKPFFIYRAVVRVSG